MAEIYPREILTEPNLDCQLSFLGLDFGSSRSPIRLDL